MWRITASGGCQAVVDVSPARIQAEIALVLVFFGRVRGGAGQMCLTNQAPTRRIVVP
jgi:hypothetical protein